MNDPRSRSTSKGEGAPREALGDVARDVMDHVSMIARDEAKMARLAWRRYVEHMRRDVAPRALMRGVVGVSIVLAGLCALLALFLGIAAALDSVAWTFLIFAGLFAFGAIAVAGFAARPAATMSSEEIARRFPAARTPASEPEHALVRQTSPEGHRAIVAEARREALDEGERRVERWEVAPHHNGHAERPPVGARDPQIPHG